MNLFNDSDSGAAFSKCRRYRYALWRIWDTSKPLVMFIGLNPSRANEAVDDPTIRRVKSLANSWGYGGVYMMNLFAFVTPYPEELEDFTDEVIVENSIWLNHIAKKCDKVIFAWGNFEVNGMDKEVIKMFPDAEALHINKNGSPKHPLYVRSDIQPIKFKQPTI